MSWHAPSWALLTARNPFCRVCRGQGESDSCMGNPRAEVHMHVHTYLVSLPLSVPGRVTVARAARLTYLPTCSDLLTSCPALPFRFDPRLHRRTAERRGIAYRR